jgi:TolA-binding protein
LAQAAPQDAAPAAAATLADHTQLLQTMARDLANMERDIEQLKANQQQRASDNSKAIEELKASQEEIKRLLARISEQNLPKTSPPPPPPPPRPALRKPERTLQPPYARARPPMPREWIYDDEW